LVGLEQLFEQGCRVRRVVEPHRLRVHDGRQIGIVGNGAVIPEPKGLWLDLFDRRTRLPRRRPAAAGGFLESAF